MDHPCQVWSKSTNNAGGDVFWSNCWRQTTGNRYHNSSLWVNGSGEVKYLVCSPCPSFWKTKWLSKQTTDEINTQREHIRVFLYFRLCQLFNRKDRLTLQKVRISEQCRRKRWLGYAYVLQWAKQTNLNFDINHKKWYVCNQGVKLIFKDMKSYIWSFTATDKIRTQMLRDTIV